MKKLKTYNTYESFKPCDAIPTGYELLLHNRIHLRKKIIRDIQTEILEKQKSCEHRLAVKEYKVDTCNWCRDNDCHWIEVFCPICLKSWNVKSNEKEYKMYRTINDLDEYRRLILNEF